MNQGTQINFSFETNCKYSSTQSFFTTEKRENIIGFDLLHFF